jgi:hypothetical protein
MLVPRGRLCQVPQQQQQQQQQQRAPGAHAFGFAAFYTFWMGFSSKRPMAAAEKWDIRDAPNRDTR